MGNVGVNQRNLGRTGSNCVFGNIREGEWEFRVGSCIEIRHGMSHFIPNPLFGT